MCPPQPLSLEAGPGQPLSRSVHLAPPGGRALGFKGRPTTEAGGLTLRTSKLGRAFRKPGVTAPAGLN